MSGSTRARITAALRSGDELDLSDSAGGLSSIAAEDLRSVLTQQRAHDPRGVKLRRARIQGRLDLRHADLAVPLQFSDCDLADGIDISGARLAQLVMTDSHLHSLVGNHAQIQGDVNLSGSVIRGHMATEASASATAAIWLCEARIGGRLLLAGTRIDAPDGTAMTRAIQADRLNLSGTARFIRGFAARGEIRLIGAQIKGSLDFTSARLSAPSVALDLGEANIGGSLFLIDDPTKPGDGPKVDGRIDMGNAQIRGRMMVQGLTIQHPASDDSRYHHVQHGNLKNVAISAPRVRVDGDLTIRSSSITGVLDLRSAEVGGDLEIQDSRLHNPEQTALALTGADLRAQFTVRGHPVDDATHDSSTAIDGSVYAPGLRVRGSLNWDTATFTAPFIDERGLASSVVLSHSLVTGPAHLRQIKAPGVIQGVNLDVEGSLRLRDCQLGGLKLDNARVDQMLDIESVELGSDSIASLERVIARSGARLTWRSGRGSVSLADASLGDLTISTVEWPGRYSLKGLQFASLTDQAANDKWADSTLKLWLSNQVPRDPSVYGEYARSLQAQGSASEAESVLMEGLRQRRQTLPLPRRAFGRMHDWLVGYGYRPLRAGGLLFALICAVLIALWPAPTHGTLRAQDQAGQVYSTERRLTTVINQVDSPALTPTSSVNAYNPALFAIDSVVPLIDLGQRTTWHPDTSTAAGQSVQYLLAASNISGWILSTVLVLSMSSLARRLT